MKRSIIWLMPKEELQKVVDNSTGFKSVLEKIGILSVGGSWEILKSRIIKDNISLDSMEANKRNKKKLTKKIPLEDILVNGSNYNRGHLKQRLIANKILDNKCYDCGMGATWNNKELVMVIDHINGVNNDNRIENLRLLCPNCNSQTKTFSGRNSLTKKLRPVKLCVDCNKEISVMATRCRRCSSLKNNKRKVVNRPSKEELEKIIKENSLVKVGNMFGVSDNTIRKWAMAYNMASIV